MRPQSRRQERLADLLKRRISEAILQEVQDPRIGFVTITGVNLSGDLRIAQVYVSVLGDEKRALETLQALQHARRFLERTMFRTLGLKMPVELRFRFDESLERAA
ncbi:MAG: 30S ribosome-binding factor RbfA, partial [Acidobacteria bacterium]|nr:30S ribosome-binding factor RbfA [Acidobacteriota bacterium]